MIKSRKMTLENRIARLERLLKNESSNKFESFESDLDEDGAREAANRLAKQFAQMVGVRLTRSDQPEIVDSPMFGWLRGNEVEDIAEDPDAAYTFAYDVAGHPGATVYVRPTEGTICVWQSLEDGVDGEGAVDPKTGECNWNDDISSGAYPLSSWNGFNMDMIHGEEYESVRRPMRRTRNESTRKFTRR